MHKLLADKLIASIRTRVSQGDNPTEPALSVENLEDLVLTLAGRSEVPASAEEALRKLRRTLEMQANIMRDPKRTGAWEGADRVAHAFDSAAEKVEAIRALMGFA